MKKLKTYLIALTKISLICLAFFVFSPSLKAHAMFSDTASINMGIKLELGTVSLATKDTTISKDVRFTDGKPVLISESILINNGSLTGKIAYKIDVKKEDETDLKAEELQDMSVIIDFGGVANKVTASGASLNTKKFTFAKDSSSNDVIVEPDSLGILATVNYKNNDPTKDKKLKVTVTFRLIQSNAADANAEMFSDEESLTNTVTLIPKVTEVESDWPAADTFVDVKGKFSYSLEKMNMVFSETYDTLNESDKKVKNLNKAILYIKIIDPEIDLNTLDIATGNKDVGIITNEIEIDEKNRRIKIPFKLEAPYSSNESNKNSYSLNLEIKMKNKNSNEIYGTDTIIPVPFFATRLILSSDLVEHINGSNAKYTQSPIKLTKDKELFLSFKTFNASDVESIDPSKIKEVQFELSKNLSNHVVCTTYSKNKFSLLMTTNASIKGTLNIKITGDAGNTLVIQRNLENESKSTIQYSIMRSMSVPLTVKETEEPAEQVTDSEESTEESDSTMDSSVVDESAVEIPIEESDEEKLIDETEVTEEVVDSSSVDSSVESTK